MDIVKSQLTTPLAKIVQNLVTSYLAEMGTENVSNLRTLVIEQIEPALLEEVLKRARYNQSTAARHLGLSRATFRTKLIQHFDHQYCGMRESG